MTATIELLQLFSALRPKDYRVQIVRPDGSVSHDEKFGTVVEAQIYAKEHADPATDLVMTRHTSSCERN